MKMGDVNGSSTSSHSLSENGNSSRNEGGVPVRGAHPYDPSSNMYDMSKNRLMYIFNHETYQETEYFNWKRPPHRNETGKDVQKLTETFGQHSFQVNNNCNDLTHDEIMNKLEEICAMDHTNTSCLAIAILTHGEAGGNLYAADKKYPLTDVINYIMGEKRLAGKPKLFFIQACRGGNVDMGHWIQFDGERGGYTIPRYADFLLLMSTIDNHVSSRTWMIQVLCEVLEETRNQDLHILDVITLMNNRVKDRTSSSNDYLTKKSFFSFWDSRNHEEKQFLKPKFTLTKFLKF